MIDEKTKAMLAADLPRDVVKTRSQAGQNLSYVSGDYIVRRLNEVFGFDGWSFLAEPAREVYRGTRPGKDGENLVIVYEVRGTLRAAGVERVDVGVGQCDAGTRALAQGIEKALKEAATDALKRCARTFGSGFGLALYDKSGAGIGLSTTALALLDEIEGAETVAELDKVGARVKGATLDDDERDVLRGTFAGRRREFAAQSSVPATVVVQPAQQLPAPEPQQPTPAAPVAAPRPSPARAQLVERLDAARSIETIVAVVLAAPLSDEERAAVRPTIAGAAERLGVASDALRGRLDAARKLSVTAPQWGTVAEILGAFEAAKDVGALDAARKAAAARATGLPETLLAGLKRRAGEIRNALGAPSASADAWIAEAQAATSVDALRAIHQRLAAAASAGTVTPEDAQRVTDALNDRGEDLAMRAAS